MKDGHIVEQGDHDTLLAQGGFYAKLYNSQFEGCGDLTLQLIAIQLFNAAAVDRISQSCRLNAALISWLAIKFAINDFGKEYNRVER